jgi:hypothetical protein
VPCMPATDKLWAIGCVKGEHLVWPLWLAMAGQPFAHRLANQGILRCSSTLRCCNQLPARKIIEIDVEIHDEPRPYDTWWGTPPPRSCSATCPLCFGRSWRCFMAVASFPNEVDSFAAGTQFRPL